MDNVNLLEIINDSVVKSLTQLGLPDTPHNRIETLNGMYKTISTEPLPAKVDRFILQEIQDEVIRLQDEV